MKFPRFTYKRTPRREGIRFISRFRSRFARRWGIIWKRVILFPAILAILMGTVLTPAAFADDALRNSGETATDRTTAMINLAKNKDLVDTGASQLTSEELRILGTFVSNFYTPFQTQFSHSGVISEKDKDLRKQTLESMQKALQDSVHMSESSAKSVTNYVFGQIWKSSQDLYVAYTDSDYTQANATWSKANLSSAWGYIPYYVAGKGYKAESKAKQAKWNALVYDKDGKTIPAFVWDPSGAHVTPSVVALYQALGLSDLSSGMGSYWFDLTRSEIDFQEGKDTKSEDVDVEKLKKFLEQSPQEMTVFAGTMALSPFGDLVYKGPNHTFVAIPAAMNPVSWVSVGSNGSEGAPSGIFNPASFQSAVYASAHEGYLTNSEGTATVDVAKLATGIKRSFGFDADATDKEDPSFDLKRRIQIGTTADAFKDDSSWWNPFDNASWDGVLSTLKTKLQEQNTKFTDSDFNVASLVNTSERTSNFGFLQHVNNSVRGADTGSYRTWVGYKVSAPDRQGAFTSTDVDTDVKYRQMATAQKFYALDSLDAFEGTKPQDAQYQDVFSFLDNNKPSTNVFSSTWDKVVNSETTYSQIANGVPAPLISSFFASYTLASFGSADVHQKLGWKYAGNILPEINPNIRLDLDPEEAKNEKIDAITDYLYFLLNPSWETVNYFAQLLTSKLSGLLIRWHNDMTGAQAVSIVQGTTKYIGFAGYVSTPNLHDLSWTDTIIQLYNNYSVFLILFVVIVLAAYSILRIISWKQALGGAVIFLVVAISIFPALNSAVNISNSFSDSVYSKKFTYWAVVTHQTYSTAIDEAASGDDYSNYLRTIYRNSPSGNVALSAGVTPEMQKANAISNRGGENILLKWQSPKKRTAVELGKDVADAANQSPSLRKLLNGAVSSSDKGETFLDDPNSTYLYRSYIDLSNASRYTYRGISSRNTNHVELNDSPDTTNWSKDLQSAYKQYKDAQTFALSSGYENYPTGNSDADSLSYINPVLSSKIVNDHLADVSKLDKMTLNDYVGIPSGAFQFPLGVYTQKKSATAQINEQKPAGYDASSQPYTDSDYNALGAYSLFTESPYYYFSWYAFDHGLSADSGASEGYRNMVLRSPNQGFFYNNAVQQDGSDEVKSTEDNNGELKDYLGMRALFTYTIPYLNQANQVVKEYAKRYSLTTYPNLPFNPGEEGSFKDDKENRQKYWQNVNVAQLANMHSAWVDQMYDASYAKPEKITVRGKVVTIQDPLNPASYPEDRPMVFSPSEMSSYGLTRADLTQVESRIMDVLENAREGYFELLNYYTFQDNVLDSAISMLNTFEFNKAFSDNSLFTQGITLYPQSYELKNFSYDSYLRLILSNSLQKDVLNSNNYDFYKEVVQESSMTTALMLIVTDFVSIYIIPLLKYGALLALAVVAFFFICSTVFKVQEGKLFSKACKIILVPLLKFLAITLGMSWVISLLIGTPVDGVTGTLGFSIRFGEPVMTLIFITILNIAVAILYFMLLKVLVKDIKTLGAGVFTAAAGALAGVATLATRGMKGISSGANAARGLGRSAIGAGKRAWNSKYNPRSSAGIANSRANVRAKLDREQLRELNERKRAEKLKRVDANTSTNKPARTNKLKSSTSRSSQTTTALNKKVLSGKRKRLVTKGITS